MFPSLSLGILSFLIIGVCCSTNNIVHIYNGRDFIKYLCSSSNFVDPNTNLVIENSIHLLKSDRMFCLVENTTNLSIAASEELLNRGELYVTVTCERDTGFGFFNVSHLTIRSVYFKNCDHVIPETAVRYINGTNQYLYYDNNVRASLIFNHCFNITLYNVLFTGNPSSYGLIGANLCGHGNISVVMPGDHPKSFMLFYYTDSPAYLTCYGNLFVTSNHLSGQKYSNNLAKYRKDRVSISSLKKYSFYLLLTQQSFQINVDIKVLPTLRYKSGNSINMIIGFINGPPSLLLSPIVTFRGYPHNVCSEEGRSNYDLLLSVLLNVIFYDTSKFSSFSRNSFYPILIENTSFITDLNHEADSFLRFMKFNSMQGSSYQTFIKMDNVTWCKITTLHAYYKSLARYFYAGDDGEHSLHLELNNIVMKNNNQYDKLRYSVEQIFFYLMELSGVNMTLTGTNIFSSNGAAFAVINVENGNLTLTGNMIISDEYVLTRGGIILSGSSHLYLKEPLMLKLSNNIMVKSHNKGLLSVPKHERFPNSMLILPKRVYSLENITMINISLHFRNNTFVGSGYRTLLNIPQANFINKQVLSPKFLFGADTWDSVHSQYAYTTLIDTILIEIDDLDKYSSLSNGLCLQLQGRLPWTCMYIDQIYKKVKNLTSKKEYPLSTYVYPGGVIFTALYRNVSSEKMYSILRLYYDDDFDYYYPSDIIRNDTLFSHIVYYCSKQTKPGPNIKYILYNDPENINVPNIPIINVSFYPYCPPGFKLSRGCYCDCIPALQENNYFCDISSYCITNPLSYLWTGLKEINGTVTVTIGSNCPPNYCNLEIRTIHLEEYFNDSEYMCLNNRRGVLCGECKENYSAVFGSDGCYSHCTHLYLLTLPVYALAGLLLVVLLFGLRLTVATGTINGVIFYANMIGLVMQKLTENHSGTLLNIIRVLISLLNLELGFPLCFYKGMTPAAKIGFLYIFPIYLWSIVIGLIILSKYSLRVSRLILNSSVQVLVTLFYLSYSKFLRIPIDIISYSTLQLTSYYRYSNDPEYVTAKVIVWFYTGAGYGSGIHALYLTLSISMILFFLLPYAVFTTSSYYLLKFRLVNMLKPFIDAHCGPFKDKYKFWFGLRIWITSILYTTNGILKGSNFDTMLLLHIVVIGTFIYLQTLHRPFKNNLIGFFDVFFMINYLLILEAYLVCKTSFSYIYIVLICIALSLILIYHFLYILETLKCFRKLKIRYVHRGYKPISTLEESNKADEQLLDAAEGRLRISAKKTMVT